MTDIKMLPLPEDLVGDLYDYEDRELRYRPTRAAIHSAIQDYARAVAEHNVKERDAEIEALRAEAIEWRGLFGMAKARADKAEARAERLAEALLELCNVIDGHEVPVAVEGKAAHARDALRDHEQVGAK